MAHRNLTKSSFLILVYTHNTVFRQIQMVVGVVECVTSQEYGEGREEAALFSSQVSGFLSLSAAELCFPTVLGLISLPLPQT